MEDVVGDLVPNDAKPPSKLSENRSVVVPSCPGQKVLV